MFQSWPQRYIVNVIHLLVALIDFPSDPVAVQIAKDVSYKVGPRRVPVVLADILAKKLIVRRLVRVGGYARLEPVHSRLVDVLSQVSAQYFVQILSNEGGSPLAVDLINLIDATVHTVIVHVPMIVLSGRQR